MGVFVYCYTATGKSTLNKKYANVIDMESTIYKYINTPIEIEKEKGTKREINNDYPNNYFKALENVKNKYDYILVSDNICDKWFQENNIEYWQVYPNIDLKEEYLNRMKQRGNNQDFIDYQSKLWNEWVKGCKNDKFAAKHIELQEGQYLEDVLPNLKLKVWYDRLYKRYFKRQRLR